MNLPNKLTLTRMGLIPLFVVLLLPQSFGFPENANLVSHSLALLVFAVAAYTDYLDGVLARRHGWITDFGKLLDPLADKLVVMAAFVGMIELELFAAWMVILILAREFLVTGLRTMAVGSGKVLVADRWGKNKTISQMVTVIAALVFLIGRDLLAGSDRWDSDLPGRWERWGMIALTVMMVICVALTVFSGWNYLRMNWGFFKRNIQ